MRSNYKTACWALCLDIKKSNHKANYHYETSNSRLKMSDVAGTYELGGGRRGGTSAQGGQSGGN